MYWTSLQSPFFSFNTLCFLLNQIFLALDEMGTRIDDLERNIADLMTQAGVEGPDKWYLKTRSSSFH